jgi:hypothetical protein
VIRSRARVDDGDNKKKHIWLRTQQSNKRCIYVAWLAVRRTSVTVDAHALQHAGLIKYSRGKIQILDVDDCTVVRASALKQCGRNTASCSATSWAPRDFRALSGSQSRFFAPRLSLQGRFV